MSRSISTSAAGTTRAGTPWRSNAEVPGATLRARGVPGHAELERALDRGMLTLRGADRVLRVAWTLADLAGAASPTRAEVGQALLLRTRSGGAR